MLVIAAVSLIQQRLGFRRDMEDKILAELDLAQAEEESQPELPWFLETVAIVPVPANSTSLPMRTLVPGFLREVDNDGVYFTPEGSSYVILEKEDRAILREAYGTGTGTPKGYSAAGYFWILYPTPAVAGQLELACYVRDVLPSAAKAAMPDSTATNVWLTEAADVLVNKALLRMATALNNQKVMNAAMQEYAAARQRMYNQGVAMAEQGRYRRMGDMQ